MKRRNIKFVQRRYFAPLKKLLYLLLTVSVLIIVYTKVRNSDRFYINSYKYTGIVHYINAKDFEHVVEENIRTQKYFSFNNVQLEKILKSNFLAIKNVKITKKFPASIKIQVQERTPIAMVIDKEQSNYLIDADGYVLGLTDGHSTELPTVNYENKLFVGQFIDVNIIPIALQILNAAKSSNVKVSSVSFKPDYSSFYSGTTQVYLNNSGDISRSLKIVAQMLAQSAIEGKKVTKVDLRYDKVIVSYE